MEADIIVVGGGSAGCAMAGRLAAPGVKLDGNGRPMGLAVPAASPATISRNDACNVVSVMPYMLISRGRCECTSSHGARRCGSSASPPNTTASSFSDTSGCSASTACNA